MRSVPEVDELGEYVNTLELYHAFFRALFAFGVEFMVFTGKIKTHGNEMELEMGFLFAVVFYLAVTVFLPRNRVVSFVTLGLDTVAVCAAVWVGGRGDSPLAYALPLLVISAGVRGGVVPAGVVAGVLTLFMFGMTSGVEGVEYQRYLMWVGAFGSALIGVAYLYAPRAAGGGDRRLELLYLDMERQNGLLEQRLVDMEQKLHTYTIFDTVTGLKNFRYFRVRVEEEVSRARRQKYPFSLCIMSVDGLEEFAGMYGKQECEKVMQKVSHTLQKLVRDTDLIAKHADDQFAMLLPQATPKQSLVPVMRIKKKLDAMTFGPNNTFQLVFSFGVSGFPDDVEEIGGMFSLAASALERSRERKPGSVTLASSLWRPAG